MPPLTHPRLRRLARAGSLLAIVFGAATVAGYRLPGFDRHRDWQKFPHLNNPRLVVAPVYYFGTFYGHRFRLPASIEDPYYAYDFEEYYRTNLRNVRSLGFQRTGNDFTWELNLNFGNGTAPGRDAGPTPDPIRPEGYEYLEVRLAGVHGQCKAKVYEGNSALPRFYQYNRPATARDTLFLRYQGQDYRVSVR